MEQKHSDWLTVSFLNQCVNSKDKYKGLRVISFDVEPALPPGSNIGSFVLRASVRVQGESSNDESSLSIIIKCPLVMGAISENFYGSVLDCEPVFYNKFLPLCRKLLNHSFAPESFSSPISSVVVLEDLKEAGYLMAEKGVLLDYHQCRYYFLTAARFHAVSVAVHKENPDLVHSLGTEKIISDSLDDSTVKNMLRYGLEIMEDRLSKSSGDQRLVQMLKECSTKIWDILVEAVKPNDKFNALTQGDPWATNMMFKYNADGKACDAKLLDFQGLRYGSPVCDLIYFLWTSADLDVLQNKQEELYHIYLERLNFHLKDMHLKEVLTMETLQEHRLKLSPLALMGAEIGPPLILSPTVADIPSMFARFREDYRPTENPYEDLYSEDYCRLHFPRLLEQLQTDGVFDYLEVKIKDSI